MKPGNGFGGNRNRTQSNAYNRKEMVVVSRQVSVPIKSSSTTTRDHRHHQGRDSIDSVDFIPSGEENIANRSFRPRSAVLSSSTTGLPSLSGKGVQHPYIIRKGSQRKVMKSTSSAQSMPDLITVSCDEIVRMAGHGEGEEEEKGGDGENTNRIVSFDANVQHSSADNHHPQPKKHGSSFIDFGEDCLNESSLNRLNLPENTPTLRRTLSDALIIPDPFEREQDDPLSQDGNLNNLDNILV